MVSMNLQSRVIEEARGGGSNKRPNLLQKLGSFFNPGQYKQGSGLSRTEFPNTGITDTEAEKIRFSSSNGNPSGNGDDDN